ncbi:unannotated protein [freshwater metagenome]|uniref:Unannotated protein n=1 Tax=freshwater metagenome TaxID=449393 RepID=A0A6J5Z930_9ZZZZ
MPASSGFEAISLFDDMSVAELEISQEELPSYECDDRALFAVDDDTLSVAHDVLMDDILMDAIDNDLTAIETEDNWVAQPTELSSVEVRKSTRRKRSVVAFRENGRTVVVVPARMKQSDIDEHVTELVGRLDVKDMRAASTEALLARAKRLVANYLDHDVLTKHKVPVTIRWVTNQKSRWGSCTASEGTIRLSHRLFNMPDYVIDCVLLHELIHLVEPNHGPKFHTLMNRFEQLEIARAFLEGVSHSEQHGLSGRTP